jgi:hypothetical protein
MASGRTVLINGKTVAVHNIASVHVETKTSRSFSVGIAFIIVAVLFFAGAASDPSFLVAALILGAAGAALVAAGRKHILVVDLNSARQEIVRGKRPELERLAASIKAAMDAPEVTVTTTLSDAADLVARGLLSRDEWNGLKSRAAGWSPIKHERVAHELEHLAAMKQKGLLSDSEFNDRKWDVLARVG